MATPRREAPGRARPVRPPDMPDGKTPSSEATHEQSQPAAADRWQRIAAAAYMRAERRGFARGAELEDWLEAEKEVDAQLRQEASDLDRG